MLVIAHRPQLVRPAVRDQTVLLITHRTEGHDLSDRVVAPERPDGSFANPRREVGRQ